MRIMFSNSTCRWVIWSIVTIAIQVEPVHGEDAPHNQRTGGNPVYQRHRLVDPTFPADVSHANGRRDFDRHPRAMGRPFKQSQRGQPQGSSGSWFQRPYPYHLDYYRMRFGGTYEPYDVGGLYGTPQVIAPPIYGYGFGQSYGYGPGPIMGYGNPPMAAPQQVSQP